MRLPALLLFLITATSALAADSSLVAPARGALEKATRFMQSIATEGGYLWKYSADLQHRSGEVKATATQIWVQPPGTPAMGMAFLRAHAATGEARFLDAARAAGVALARGQLESGGWDYLIEFDPKLAAKWHRRSDDLQATGKRKNISTFDDDNTQNALRFLLALADASKGSTDSRDEQIRAARDYGLKKMLEAQYPNGAWPQRYDGQPRRAGDFPVQRANLPQSYPRTWPGSDYKAHYTLNDNTHRDCIVTMLDAFHRTGQKEFLQAAIKGGEFILLAQLPEPQPVWAQQYNAAMQPDWARAFEPPAVTGSESAGAIRILVDLYIETGLEKFLQPIPAAIAWYQRSAIKPNHWARYYELKTNKPIYGDRDGKIYSRLEEISEERRTGYSWQGGFGVSGAIAHYEKTKKAGRVAMLEELKPKPASDKQKASRATKLEPQVREIVAALDSQGRWLTRGDIKKRDWQFGDRIETSVFIKNAGILCDYLEAAK